jgi:hypothetical protein
MRRIFYNQELENLRFLSLGIFENLRNVAYAPINHS